MKVIKTIAGMQKLSAYWRKTNTSIGFIPTMGALHDGHRALIDAARRTNTIVVVSVFVNPLQFESQHDFRRYPKTVKNDKRLCEGLGVDVLFIPDGEVMYPAGFQTTVLVRKVTRNYEGQVRPTHFEGVTTVVTKLCHMITPDRIYFGQKDYQQAVVVKRMLIDLNMPITLQMLPTVRESDGVAMSSRNVLLTPNQRAAAGVVYRALQEGMQRIRAGERRSHRIHRAIEDVLNTERLVNIDYIGIMHPETLDAVRHIERRRHGKVVVAVAAHVGETRIIDNVIVRVPNG